VTARKGYASPKGKPATGKNADKTAANAMPEVLRDAINSPLPVSGLGVTVFAAPFKGPAPNASVLVGTEVRGRDLNLSSADKLLVSYFAIDAQGKVHPGSTDTITLNLRPETKARVEQSGFRILNRIELPPGRYQLRVGANDSAGGTVGAVSYDLEVPDFNKGSLTMSGLAITSATASLMPTARPDEQLRAVLPAPPVALRQFPRTDQLVVFAEVYDNEAANLHKVDITTTVTSDDGKVVSKSEEERSSSDIQGKRGGYGYTAKIAMQDLQPGLYVLKVEARSRLGKSEPVAREVPFRIVG
jgi:hypothetical protein